MLQNCILKSQCISFCLDMYIVIQKLQSNLINDFLELSKWKNKNAFIIQIIHT